MMPLSWLPMLYCLTVVQRAICGTISNAFLKSIKGWKRSFWCCRYFSDNTWEIENLFHCSSACSKSCLFLCEYKLCFWLESVEQYFKHNFGRQDIRLMVLYFLHSCTLPFLDIVIPIDFVHCSSHIFVCHILCIWLLGHLLYGLSQPLASQLVCCLLWQTFHISMIVLPSQLLIEEWCHIIVVIIVHLWGRYNPSHWVIFAFLVVQFSAVFCPSSDFIIQIH